MNLCIDEAYYLIKRKFHMSDAEFWASSYRKINYLIMKLGDEYGVESDSKPQVQEITSMKQINGWC